MGGRQDGFFGNRLKEGRREHRGREGQEVEADEEKFVQGAENEQNVLHKSYVLERESDGGVKG